MKKLSFLFIMIALLNINEAIGQWSYNGVNIYNTNTGNVGIGTNAPSSLLYVTKYTTEPTITIRNLGGTGGATYSMIDDASGANWKFKATLNGGFKIRDHANELDIITIEPNSIANAFYIKNTGNIGINTSTPDNSAQVDITSTTKGFLLPRMTNAELLAIVSPAEGLLVYCTNCGSNGAGAMSMFMAGAWKSLSVNNCLNAPSATTEGTHVPSETQIIWNWNPVSGALGYKWNTTNDYATAEDRGVLTSKVETGLTGNTSFTRYVWTYNDCGSSPVTNLTSTTTGGGGGWTCGTILTDQRDGQSYNTVLIGTQCWMAENLNIGSRINISQNPTDNGIIEKYCYNDSEVNCDTYGGLYQWHEMMQYVTNPGDQGICTDGWHVATDEEWCTLKIYLDPTVDCFVNYSGTNIGIKMKSTTGWNSGWNGTNESGFTGLPGGVRYPSYTNGLGDVGDFWSSTMIDNTGIYHILGLSNIIGHFNSAFGDGHGFSVRCIKDN